MAWNSKCLSSAWCVLPFILSKIPLRLCTISIQIPEIIWAGLSVICILKYLQTSSLPNIPNCNTAYQLPYLRFISLYLWIRRDQIFFHQTMSHHNSINNLLLFIYSIGLSCTTAHNTAPHVYIALGYIGINNFIICFHMSRAKPQLYKQCLAVSITSVQKGHILSTFPFRHPLIGKALYSRVFIVFIVFILQSPHVIVISICKGICKDGNQHWWINH